MDRRQKALIIGSPSSIAIAAAVATGLAFRVEDQMVVEAPPEPAAEPPEKIRMLPCRMDPPKPPQTPQSAADWERFADRTRRMAVKAAKRQKNAERGLQGYAPLHQQAGGQPTWAKEALEGRGYVFDGTGVPIDGVEQPSAPE